MGFYVSIDKYKMDVLRMLQKKPEEVFGKPYGGYILFLAGGADQEILLWISENIAILDSLTGDDIAFGIFAQNFRCRLNMRNSTQKNSADRRIIDMTLGHLEKSPLPGFPDRGGSSWDMSLTQLNHGELGFFEVPLTCASRWILRMHQCPGCKQKKLRHRTCSA